MKPSNYATQNFGFVTTLDLLFTGTFVAMTSRVLGLAPAPTAGLMMGLAAIRIAGYWVLFRRLVRPSDDLQQRAQMVRPISDEALRDVDNLLQQATGRISTFTTLGWTVSLPLMVGLYHLLVGPSELHSLELWVVGALVLVCIFGPFAIVSPLLTWGLADAAGQNHLLAVERGIDLERPQRSIAARIATLGLCLAGVPTLLVISATLATVDRDEYTAAQYQARAVAQELRHHASTVDAAVAVTRLEPQPGQDRASWFVIAPSTEPVFAGAPAPAWATPERLVSAVDRSFEPPDRSYAVQALRLPDGRVAGALVEAANLKSGFVALFLTVLVLAGLFGLISAWLLSRSVSRPLERTAMLARRAAREGDLSHIGTLPVAQLDDVGLVVLNLNELLDSMRAIAVAAGKVGAGELAVELQGRGELPDAFRRMLDQLSSVVTEMHGMSSELASAATEILAATQEQDAAATSHSTGMTEITQTMDSLSGSAAHVATAVEGVLENAERTLQNTDQMVTRIDELTGHANRIGDILDVIREIAERTDLLALNGSLEASRAGEAGVGFSLVASEMRRLAERVTASVGDIKALVADIRESGASTVVATEESKKLAEGTTQAARKITLVTQQQRSSTEQVTQNVRSVAEVIQQAVVATSQTKDSAEALKKQADRLTVLVRRFRLHE